MSFAKMENEGVGVRGGTHRFLFTGFTGFTSLARGGHDASAAACASGDDGGAAAECGRVARAPPRAEADSSSTFTLLGHNEASGTDAAGSAAASGGARGRARRRGVDDDGGNASHVARALSCFASCRRHAKCACAFAESSFRGGLGDVAGQVLTRKVHSIPLMTRKVPKIPKE